jgi:hypothetical protein
MFPTGNAGRCFVMAHYVIGWIHIEDTDIDYPVVQSDDNEYYLTRDLHEAERLTARSDYR